MANEETKQVHKLTTVYSTAWVLPILFFSIFVVEMVVMLLLVLLPPFSIWVEALVDTTLLIVLLFPILYFPLFRRMMRHMGELERTKEALRRSQDETGRTQRLLLAFSQAAQAVQRARTPDEVYRIVGDEVVRLGYHAMVLSLTPDRASLIISYTTYEPTLFQATTKLTGLPIQDYRLPLVPGSFYQRMITEGGTVFTDRTRTGEIIAESLPGPLRPLVSQLAAMARIEQGITARLTVGGEAHGVLGIFGIGLTEAEVPAVTAFASQTAIALENARAEEALRQSEEKYRSLYESSRDGIISADMEGHILDVNQAYMDLLGYSKDELRKLAYQQLTPLKWHESDADIIEHQVLARGYSNEFEKEFIRKDGTIFPISIRVWLIRNEQEQPVGTWAIVRDITGRKRGEAELRKHREHLAELVEERTAELKRTNEALEAEIAERRRAEEKLKLTLAELERSNKELEQFAYVASHDLQEPLRMVSSYTQLLARRYQAQLDADANEFIAFAVDGANRMQRLINDLLAYSRVGTHGKGFQPTDCTAVFDQTLANLKAAVEQSGAAVTHDPLPTVMADKLQLAQLFQNLIGNAIKFHGEEPPRVYASAEQKDNAWVFSVRDNGIGIDPRYVERIFVLFQRLHTREEYPGTGIGLAICKKIVERHGGRIWVESQPGIGSTFYFTIPIGGNGL